ncbi:MAG: ROK family protein [Rhodobacteraceae bacterium]|nr:ROK family protein [Paracoccaceae bacterium]
MAGLALGIYYAQDKVIVGSIDASTGKIDLIDKKKAPSDGIENIYLASKIITDNFSNVDVVGVCQAVPSTIKILDRHDVSYGRIGLGIGPRNWTDMNVVSELQEALRRFGSPLDSKTCAFPIISQVGATALGEYNSRFPSAFAGPNAALNRRQTGNIIHIVADHGIGVAILNQGHLFRGTAVPNIGHMLIRPIAGEIYKECRHHPERSCLNAMASLGAIEAKWGIDAKKFEVSTDTDMIAEIALYFAQAITNLIYLSSPNQIIIGGRMSKNKLFIKQIDRLIRMDMAGNNGIIPEPFDSLLDTSNYLSAQREDDAGVLGACRLAADWAKDDKVSTLRS